mgnify:CR=1 FL=1
MEITLGNYNVDYIVEQISIIKFHQALREKVITGNNIIIFFYDLRN